MVTDRKLFGEEKLTLLRRARILCEHEIFDPRPVYSWPLTPEDDESGNELYDPETRSMGAMLADARHRDALADWRKRMRARVQADGNWTRSEERRVGKEGVRPCRSRWWPDHQKKKHNTQ